MTPPGALPPAAAQHAPLGSNAVTRDISGQHQARTESGPRAEAPWWREAVTYQLYIRSFADGNGDGLGDLC